jgi:hypothetical protein
MMSRKDVGWQLCLKDRPICPVRDSWREAADDAVKLGLGKVSHKALWWNKKGDHYEIEKVMR